MSLENSYTGPWPIAVIHVWPSQETKQVSVAKKLNKYLKFRLLITGNKNLNDNLVYTFSNWHKGRLV